MKALLWQALFFRTLFEQKRLFAVAALTVSLGVALALGIRLGTQSAVRSLEESIGQMREKGWSDTLVATTPEAKIFLREIALRYDGQVFSTLEGSAVKTESGEPGQVVQIHVVWGSATATESGIAGEPFPPEKLLLQISKNCKTEFNNIQKLLISGKKFEVHFNPTEMPTFLGCRNSTAAPFSFSTPELGDLLQRAPLHAIFPLKNVSQIKSFEDISSLAALTPGIELEANKKRISRLEDVTISFRTNLQLMGFIALFIGFAMVHHIFSLLVAKQSKNLATLSALGISKRKQVNILISLAAFLGFAASTLGTILGLLAGFFLSGVTSATVRNLYDSLVDSQNFHWQGIDLAYGFAIGFAACFLGSIHPIVKMTKIPVAQIMRDGSFESHDSGLSLKQSVKLTALIVGLSLACLKWTIVWNRIPFTALLACLGFLVASALVAQQISHFLYEKAHLGKWQHRSATQLRLFLAPQSAVVIQVLTLTFTLTFGVKGMAESFRTTLSDWSRETLRADLWIRTVGGAGTALPEKILSRLEKASGNEAIAVDRLSIGPATMALNEMDTAKPILLAAARFAEQSKVAPMKILLPENSTFEIQSNLAQEIADNSQNCLGTRENPCLAYISEPISIHFSMPSPLGSTLCPKFRTQKVCFKVAAVYQDFGSDQGVLLTDERVFERFLQGAPKPSFSNVYLRNPNSPDAEKLNAELRRAVESSQGTLAFETLQNLQARILETFDNTFRVTDALYFLCGVIAVVATMSSLNLQILLRSREWSLQWSLGIGSQTLLRRFSIWSAFMAFLAAAVSLVGGWILSAILVYAVNYYSFGYSLTLSIPWHLPPVVLGVASLSGYLSGKLQTRSLKENVSLNALTRE